MTTVLTDIEGTTTPIAFVRDVLFPFARSRLPDVLRGQANRPDIAAELAEIGRLAPGKDPVRAVLDWMDEDAKVTPLKTLQGIVWHEGYQSGDIRGALYPDVAPAFRAWTAAGHRIAIYSSGSEAAQRLLFAHSEAGDLSPLIAGYFDTRIGAKAEAASYGRIAAALGTQDIIFLSDIERELDAAAAAGLRTCQLVRWQDGTTPSTKHKLVNDFSLIQP
jgi:enolase-phosphatase E1